MRRKVFDRQKREHKKEFKKVQMPANCDVQVSEILTRFVVVMSIELISHGILLLLIPKLRRPLCR